MLWRQGDIYLAAVPSIPADAKKQPHCVLAEGEVTGHSHRVERGGVAELFADGPMLYLNVTAESARIVHDEHNPITLTRGTYRVWRQREYTPGSIRIVRD